MKRNLPHSAADFINEVEKFSGASLDRKAELISIAEEAERNGKDKVFEDLIFTAKYLMSVIRARGKSIQGIEKIDHVKKDFSAKLLKASDLIKEILSSSDEKVKDHFEQSFFGPPEESIYNLNELLAGLEQVELYVNEKKRMK